VVSSAASPPAGYRSVETLSTGTSSSVYRAVRETDGAEVILKVYARSGDNAERECQVLQHVAGPGVPRYLERIDTQTLVMECAPGVALATWIGESLRSPLEVVQIALQLARILDRVHQAGLLHCDLTPANIIVDPDTLKSHLIDFGRARRLGAVFTPGEIGSSVTTVARGLHFIAPEQSGRMGRGIDARSDLYMLGATLYYALTGTTLFEGDDALALIHAHMARVPLPPHERRAEIPVALSRIVMKLLDKEPDDRYQSARALEEDLLHCHDQLERTGQIDPNLGLAACDARAGIVLPQRLYDRDDELSALREALQRATQKGPLRVVLSGAPGSGKSALVRALRLDVTRMRGTLVSGKFDRYRSARPYAGFVEAIENLAHLLLVEREDTFLAWREQLRSGMGALSRVMSDWVPDFAVILGDTPPVPPLGPRETLARLALTLRRLLACCAAPDRPLVLFLDDCQWADAGSRYLLCDLVEDFACPGLLVITAHRDREVGAHSHEAWYECDLAPADTTLELGPLGAAACAQMLAAALRTEPSTEILDLAEWVVRKSDGNPLFAREFVLYLHRTGLIRFKEDRWTCDLAEIREAAVPTGAVDLLEAKLGRLAPDTREVIEIASCTGDAFDVSHLAELTGRRPESVEPHLFELAEQGLIVPGSAGFRFSHDRIREAAQTLMGPEACAELHERMAWLLAERIPEPELPARALEIADHLFSSRPRVPRRDQRARAIALYHMAGERSLAAGAAATACPYLCAARELFREEPAALDADGAFRLFLQSVEAECRADRLPQALALLSELEPLATSPLEQSQVACQAIVIQYLLREADPVELTLQSLARFGVRIPRKPSRWRIAWEIWRTDRVLRGALDETAFPPPSGTDLRSILPPLLIMNAGAAAAAQECAALELAFIAHGIRALRRYGAIKSPVAMLGGYAAFRALQRKDLEGVARFADDMQRWLQREGGSATNVRAHFVLQAFLLSWIRPRRSVLEPLRELIEAARELGDIEHRTLVSIYLAEYGALSGEPLSHVLRDFSAIRGSLQLGVKEFENLNFDEIFSGPYQLLHDPPHSSEAARERLHEVDARFVRLREARVGYWIMGVHWQLVLVVLGRFDQAFAWAESLLPEARQVSTPGVHLADYVFLRGLSAAALAATSPGRLRRHRTARECWRQLGIWARHSPDCAVMRALLQAELSSSRPEAAVAQYASAAHAAAAAGFVHYAALAHERRAAHLRRVRRKREAASALGRAVELYAPWEAHAKVQELENQLQNL